MDDQTREWNRIEWSKIVKKKKSEIENTKYFVYFNFSFEKRVKMREDLSGQVHSCARTNIKNKCTQE